MKRIILHCSEVSSELLDGLNELEHDYGFEMKKGGIKLSAAQKDGSDIHVRCEGGKALIEYDKKIHFFRGFGLLLQGLRAGCGQIELREMPQFDTTGVMFDGAQANAAMNIRSIREFLRRMAVMGLNMLMLYCEDGFEVPEEPYFSYMRPHYAEAELRECDRYAAVFGIEMIPCIQTLAHLPDALRWKVYEDIREDDETLLVGNERTYEFIEHLISAACRPFRSRRIHIGMDEAWKLGRGKYFDEHGCVHPSEIMKKHLERLMQITRRLGLQPMIWSDMFFRSFSKSGQYYDRDADIPKDAGKLVPDGVSLVYWDYYHTDENDYRDMIDRHRIFGEPIFAGGIWSWLGFAPNWGRTLQTANPAMEACKKNNIREVFATVWGDCGTESNVFVNLLGLSLFAEHSYAEHLDEEKFHRRFEFCTGGNFDDFYALRLFDEVPSTVKGNCDEKNPSKYLLWQDLLTGLFDENIKGLELNAHYAGLARLFDEAAERNSGYVNLFRFYAQLARTLSIKAELGIKITQTYRSGDLKGLSAIAADELPRLLQEVEKLRALHRKNWFAENHALGWDVLDMRYGSLLIRIRSAGEEIGEYLSGILPRLEELEVERLPYDGQPGLVSYANYYGRIVSPSRIAPYC